MSVEVIYVGRVGNNIFQYVYARLFSIKNNLQLRTKFLYPNLLNPTQHTSGFNHNSPIIKIKEYIVANKDDFSGTSVNILEETFKNARYVLEGYFQEPSIYDNNKELVKSFFNFPIWHLFDNIRHFFISKFILYQRHF